MWRQLTALACLALLACAPALAQTGGAAPPAQPQVAPSGGVVAEPAPAPAPTPVPAPEPVAAPDPSLPAEPVPAPAPDPEPEAPTPGEEVLASIAAQTAQDDPLQDLPRLAPPADEPEPEPDPAPEAPAPEVPAETAGPQLADTGLEAFLLACLGALLLTIGCTTFAVLRKAQRLADGRRR